MYLKAHNEKTPDQQPFREFKGFYKVEDICDAKEEFNTLKMVYATKEMKKEINKKTTMRNGAIQTLKDYDKRLYDAYVLAITSLIEIKTPALKCIEKA